MSLLLDTNCLLYVARATSASEVLLVLNPEQENLFVSYVSVAEVHAIEYMNRWAPEKRQRLDFFLEEIQIVGVTDLLEETYIQLEAYSQRRLPQPITYQFSTPRNMGKHNLWIAATAAFLNLTLVTTDQDFDHLASLFLRLRKIAPEALKVRK